VKLVFESGTLAGQATVGQVADGLALGGEARLQAVNAIIAGIERAGNGPLSPRNPGSVVSVPSS
jgi:hypothetical protein